MIRGFLIFLLVFNSKPYRLIAQDIFEAARRGDISKIDKLYLIKADTVNTVNENGFTPLIIAVYRNQNEAAEHLIKLGALVNTTSPEGSAIIAAAYKNNIILCKLLIASKANVNAQNDEGVTALMYAAMGNQTEIVSLLINAGAELNMRSKSGHTALSYAKLYNFSDIIKLLTQ